MMKKATKILSILLVCWQIPMSFLWYLTYEAIKLYCHQIEVYSDGVYELVFKPELLTGELLQNSPIILALIACFVLPLLSMFFLLCRKGDMGIPSICMLGVSLMACVFIVYWFNRPYVLHEIGNTNYYTTVEFVFYRYTIPEDIFHTTAGDFYGCHMTDIFPLLQQIKFITVALHMAVCGVLMGLGISQAVHRRKQEQAVVAAEQSEESVITP